MVITNIDSQYSFGQNAANLLLPMKFIRDTITVAIAMALTAFIGLSLARLTYFLLHRQGLL
jgi:hypothetical protein